MKKKKVLSVLLAFVLAMSLSMPSLAADLSEMTEEADKQQAVVTTGNSSDSSSLETDESSESEEPAVLEESEEKSESEDTAKEPVPVAAKAAEEGTAVKAASESPVSDKWTAEDFTYTTITQTLNGCDYTRQFQISGPAIAGLSESGEKKLETNKNLVIPSRNTEGEKLVGIAQGAFKEKGLESVQFPEGMLVDYDDTVTNVVTKRGNFIIGTEAFAKNNLKSVYLPKGVIAVMSSAFRYNQLTSVSLPQTIWWIENSSFANNNLTTVGFPKTCDFQLQIHAFAFSHNQIKSVRLPDYCEVVEKKAFYWNPGMEECPPEAGEEEQSWGGVVYMYTDNEKLASVDRIHHIERTAESQKSWHQKLIIGSQPEQEGAWTATDFTFEGTVITGLSESGIEKRKTNKNLILPDKNAEGEYVTEIGSTTNSYGLFATETEKFDSVELPAKLQKIGTKAFCDNGLSKIYNFPSTLKEIGVAAFQTNQLTSVILPDSVTTLGGGAFATNPKLNTIVLSKGLTEISTGAFGCSDSENYMEDLTELVIPEGITKIGMNAFAGNNIKDLVIPSSVTEIGNYAFSTKNYLKDECKITLNEGLTTIGNRAFRNKVVMEVDLPSTVKKLPANTFEKEYSDGAAGAVTKVYVSKAQYVDKKNFPTSTYHTYVPKIDPNDTEWDSYDFTYATQEELKVAEKEITLYPGNNQEQKVILDPYYITGLSVFGEAKVEKNKDMIIPATDPQGKKVTGIAPDAFKEKGIESVVFPENVTTTYDGPEGLIADGVTERGDFIICGNAFRKNKLTSLKLPEGVIRIGQNAFAGNQLITVEIPKTMWWIDTQSFSSNQITTVKFPETCDFKLNIFNMAFAVNKIKSVQLPDRVEKLDKWAFFQNTGMEEVTTGTSAEKKGGVVYMYAPPSVASESLVACIGGTSSSNVQKLITNEPMPEKLKPWGVSDFTYSEGGTTITGLSEEGKEKRAVNPVLILPDQAADGTVITAIGAAKGTDPCGLFGAANEPITKVVLPDQLKEIGGHAFKNCGIEEVVFPKTLETIGTIAFQTNKLTKVILPDSVKTVGGGAFATNPTIEEVKISSGMTEIPASFVLNNSPCAENFVNIEIPEGITKIGSNAFAGNSFTRVEIPESVTAIESSAFAQTETHRTIKEIVLHEGLESIGSKAFSYAMVTSVELPSTVTTLNKDAFSNCTTNGEKVKLYTSNKEQLEPTSTFIVDGSDHTVLYDNLVGTGWTAADFVFDGAKVVGWSEQGQQTRLKNKELVIPSQNQGTGEAITEIGDGAFKIPDSEVEQLKDSVDSPNGMTSVRIPETVTKIGEKAFEYNSLAEVVLPESLAEIGVSAFHGNRLEEILLPDSVTAIGAGAFSMNNLTKITLPAGLTKLEQGVFSMNILLEQIQIPDTVTEIGDMAFAGARLTSLQIPKSVTRIGRKAFHLHHLTELTVPGNVKEIGESAFEGTFKKITLKKLVLEEGIETIGALAFKEGYLESVKLPNSLKSLATDAFAGNEGMDNDHVVVCYTENREFLDWAGDSWRIELQGAWDEECFTYEGGCVTGLSRIGKALIKNNPSVGIPGKTDKGAAVTGIAAGAFENSGMKAVTLPATLTTVGAKAFAGNELTNVTIPNKVTSIAKDAFAENNNTVTLAISNPTLLENLKKTGMVGVTLKDTSASEVVSKDTSVPVKVTKLKITGSSKKIAAGKKVTLKVAVTPSNANNKAVIWRSSNKKIATVNSKGVVTMKKGSAGKKVTITATAADGSGVKATYTLSSMKGSVKKVRISGAKSVKAGKSLRLKARVTASRGANKKVAWKSSNTKYAKVSASGKVKTYKAGKGKKVKITARATDGSNKKKTVTIRIR